jgi:hypothetical protein
MKQSAFFRMAQRQQVVPLPPPAVFFALDRQMAEQLTVQAANVLPLSVRLPRDNFGVVLIR